MSVLIVTSKLDPHSDEVIVHLQEKGVEVFRLNTEDLCEGTDVTLHLSEGDIQGSFLSKVRSVDIRGIKSVLYRRPKRRDYSVSSDNSAKVFVEEESIIFLRWLWETIDCFWVSKPSSIRKAESKIHQLYIAPRLGFLVPKTLITNLPEEARRFYDDCEGRIVNKVLAKGILESPEGPLAIYTRRVREKDLSNLDSVRSLPCVFQERIDKAFELRITVVGEEVFAAEIHSQSSERTRDDWRRYDIENTPHRIHSLPDSVRSSCINITRHYGLVFGAIDMIVTPEGKYVFLELNPNGQWLWIERLTGLPITDAVARLLIRGAA